ncbi:MAG TPA: MTH1187 family thiamine-binding protein [Thermodesulfobacteriota bacterium]|nr:MTH1187 family thiamine-binding protein [Thermodesulfobacteriota bacterium]
MAILQISVVPIGTSETSLSAYVADCIRVLKREKVPYELSSMGTNIEGDLKDLFKIAFKMHQTPFKKGALRVLTTLKIDDRRDKKGTLRGKKRAVENKLRRKSNES